MTEASPRSLDLHGPLYLELPGRRFPVQIRRLSSEASRHTGRKLTELHAWATTTDDATHAWLSDTLKRVLDQPVTARDAADEFLGKWQLSWNAYGEAAGVHTYTLILRECEELSLQALEVAGIELFPYEYREEVVGDGLTIWAKLVGTESDVLQVRRVLRSHDEVPVVRRGIQDEPRYMRLGVGEWAEYEDRIKYRIVLVERGVDESAHQELSRIRRENNRAALGFYMNFAERLVDLLLRKGVLSADEVEAAREAASSDPVVVRHDFWRVVADVDER